MQLQCPICKTRVVWEENPNRPFCSERCKMTDLGAWAMEKYRLAEPQDEKPASPDAVSDPPHASTRHR